MQESKSDLRKIPGVGKNIEQDLLNIGINCIADLKGRDPEAELKIDASYMFSGRRFIMQIIKC